MKIMLDKGAKMPTRAHTYDAGLDLYTPVDVLIPGCKIKMGLWEMVKRLFIGWSIPIDIGSQTIDTGVHVQIPEGMVGLIKSKSGLNVKSGLTGEGVIDAHYTGSVKVKLYNHTRYPHFFHAGEKIAQLLVIPCSLPRPDLVDRLEETDRGDGGFGSTGR